MGHKMDKTGRYFINIIEYGVQNPRYEGQCVARIEVIDEQDTKSYDGVVHEGYIDAPEEVMDAIRSALDFKYFQEVPIIRLEYKAKEEK